MLSIVRCCFARIRTKEKTAVTEYLEDLEESLYVPPPTETISNALRLAETKLRS